MSQVSNDAGTKGETSSNTPEGVFKLTESLITPEIVKQTNATFLFVIDGEHPGKLCIALCMVCFADGSTESWLTLCKENMVWLWMFKGNVEV